MDFKLGSKNLIHKPVDLKKICTFSFKIMENSKKGIKEEKEERRNKRRTGGNVK